MSAVRKALLSAAPIVSFLAMALVAAPGHAAVSVILECGSSQNLHTLYEVDYAAGTVRQHAVDDYGNPSIESNGDHTYRAQITDREIVWTVYETEDGGFERDHLGRYSGIFTRESNDPNRTPAYLESTSTCQRYVPPVIQQKF